MLYDDDDDNDDKILIICTAIQTKINMYQYYFLYAPHNFQLHWFIAYH